MVRANNDATKANCKLIAECIHEAIYMHLLAGTLAAFIFGLVRIFVVTSE